MSQVAPVFTCECRSSEVSYSSQATPTKAFPGEVQGKHVARRLYLPDELQYSLATTTFLGKQQHKQSAARNKRVSTFAVPRKNAALVQQQVSSPVQNGGLSCMRAVNVTNALQQVIPFYQLLTFIPSQMCQDTDMQAPCTVTANNLFNQGHLGTIQSDSRAAHDRESDKPGRYSVPTSSCLGPQTNKGPHSAVIDVLKADIEGKDASIAMSQLLAEALDLADAFACGEIHFEEPTDNNPANSIEFDLRSDVTSSQKRKRGSSNNIYVTNKRQKVCDQAPDLYIY